jgi:putative N6-adenine-specific DNA methylase
MEEFKMLAKTFEGLEDVLAKELEDLGAKNVVAQRRAVSFEGDMKLMYEANLWLRTAISILKPIATFPCENEQALYDGVYAIKWFEYFDVGKTFSVDTVLVNSNINHTKFAAYKVKDAIADQFRYYFNQRPDVGRKDADIFINAYISNNECIISLNSSGTPLFKRGYRRAGHKAPINEVLAAGLIKLSGWDMKSNFIDPMCGSGTMLVEAALMAYNFPPAYQREVFSFMNWSNYDPTIWRELKNDIHAKQRDFDFKIIGGDISERNLNVAREIITEMKFHKDIELKNVDVEKHMAPDSDVKGWIVTNPPYGERLKSEDLEALYAKIGTAFKFNFPGYSAWVISSDMQALKHISLKTKKKIPMLNGALECKFNGYELYSGSKKVWNDEKAEGDKAEETKPEEAANSIIKDVENNISNGNIEAENLAAEEKENELLFDLFVSEKRNEDSSERYSNSPRKEWKDKKDFKPRGDGSSSPRREWKIKKDFKSRGEESGAPRRDWKDKKDFKPRGEGYGAPRKDWKDKKDFKPRGEGSGAPRRDWKDKKDFKPRGEGSGAPRRDWKDKKDFKPRGEGSGAPRKDWKDKKDFKPKGDASNSPRKDWGRRDKKDDKPRRKRKRN